MEFWGVEVKPGEPLKIKPEVFKLIHISQAAMGEVKNGKGPNSVPIRLKVDDKPYVIGTLSAEDRPQLMFDLVLHKKFELSHDWKDGSIYFTGYIGDDDSYEDFSDEDENEDNEVDIPENGKLEPVKPDTRKTVPVPKPAEKSTSKPAKLKNDKSQPDEDDDDKRFDALEHLIDSDDSDDDDEDDDDSNDDDGQNLVSHKAKPVKKRPSETATESHVQAAKKTKLAAPEKSGGKTPATNGKLKENNPKSAGQTSCKSCSKTFNSDKALESHKKAKHDGK